MNKIELRYQTVKKLKDLAEKQSLKREKEALLFEKLWSSNQWKFAEKIAITLSMPFEVNTMPIIERAWLEGKEVYIPKCFPQRKMKFYLYQEGDSLQLSKFGVREPLAEAVTQEKQQLELVIVPGLVFRSDGYRVGFGGGYYDIFLSSYSGFTCSLAFKEQLSNNWVPDEYDIPVQELFTDGERGK